MPDLTDKRGIWVKVCGLTREADVAAAVEAGVSAVGFIFAESPRRVDVEQAARLRQEVPQGVWAVGVFGPDQVDQVARAVETAELNAVQLHGMAPPLPSGTLVMRTYRIAAAADLFGLGNAPCDAIHIDALVDGKLGGTGVTVPWEVVSTYRPRKPFVLAGGLSPDNVADAVAAVRPHGVDASSGLESEPGIKDAAKVRAFVEAARGTP